MAELVVVFSVMVIAWVVCSWLVGRLPLPEPAAEIIQVAFLVMFAVFVITILLNFAGGPPPRMGFG